MESNSQSLIVNQDDIIIFIDETGNENLSQPNYPVFGYGGIGLFYGDYKRLISHPWSEFKMICNFSHNKPLHGHNIIVGQKRIEACNQIFKNEFYRFASLITKKTKIDSTTCREIAPRAVINRINAVLKRMIDRKIKNYLITKQGFSVGKVVLIFEGSERGNALINSALHTEGLFNLSLPINSLEAKLFKFSDKARVSFANQTINYTFETKIHFMSKSFCEPGLEVAHWVINTAGQQATHNLLDNPERKFRRDYQNMFTQELEAYSDVMFINTITKSAA